MSSGSSISEVHIIPLEDRQAASAHESIISVAPSDKSLCTHKRKQSLKQKLKELLDSSFKPSQEPQGSSQNSFNREFSERNLVKHKLPSYLKHKIVSKHKLSSQIWPSESVKMKTHRKAKSMEEVKECTFKPRINNHSGSRKRTPEEHYKDMMKYQDAKDKKIQQIKQSDEVSEDFSFKPSICQKSMEILQGNPYTATVCHERLHKQYREKYSFQSYANENLFTPKLNGVSKKLFRNKSIGNRLYQDAIRRMSKHQSQTDMAISGPSENSIRILIKGFLDDFEHTCNKLQLKENTEINYTLYIEFFRNMNFLSTNRENKEIIQLISLWKMIGSVLVKDLKVIMMAVMGFYRPWMNDPDSQCFLIDESGVKIIHHKHFNLFENRIRHKLPKESERPSTGSQSKRNLSHDSKIEDYLIREGRMREERLKELREIQMTESMSQCTFKPEKNDRSAKILSNRSSKDQSSYLTQVKRLCSASKDHFSKDKHGMGNFEGTKIQEKKVSLVYEEEDKDSSELDDRKIEVSGLIIGIDNNSDKESNPEEIGKESEDLSSYSQTHDMTEVEEVNESEEDESFIVSVNIENKSQPLDLRVKTCQSAESAVTNFSKKHSLKPKEHDKLLEFVRDIINANT